MDADNRVFYKRCIWQSIGHIKMKEIRKIYATVLKIPSATMAV